EAVLVRDKETAVVAAAVAERAPLETARAASGAVLRARRYDFWKAKEHPDLSGCSRAKRRGRLLRHADNTDAHASAGIAGGLGLQVVCFGVHHDGAAQDGLGSVEAEAILFQGELGIAALVGLDVAEIACVAM